MSVITEMYREMGIRNSVVNLGKEIEATLKERFDTIDEIAEYNQLKVVHAMQKNHVSAACFEYASGYGYDDLGRDKLEKVYADVFHTESALVRPQITCGTHALALALSANLRPGDELVSVAGKPYDTLEEVIGIRPSKGSLAEYGVSYSQGWDLWKTEVLILKYPKKQSMIIQRLLPFSVQKVIGTRPSFSVEQIGEVISLVKKSNRM